MFENPLAVISVAIVALGTLLSFEMTLRAVFGNHPRGLYSLVWFKTTSSNPLKKAQKWNFNRVATLSAALNSFLAMIFLLIQTYFLPTHNAFAYITIFCFWVALANVLLCAIHRYERLAFAPMDAATKKGYRVKSLIILRGAVVSINMVGLILNQSTTDGNFIIIVATFVIVLLNIIFECTLNLKMMIRIIHDLGSQSVTLNSSASRSHSISAEYPNAKMDSTHSQPGHYDELNLENAKKMTVLRFKTKVISLYALIILIDLIAICLYVSRGYFSSENYYFIGAMANSAFSFHIWFSLRLLRMFKLGISSTKAKMAELKIQVRARDMPWRNAPESAIKSDQEENTHRPFSSIQSSALEAKFDN